MHNPKGLVGHRCAPSVAVVSLGWRRLRKEPGLAAQPKLGRAYEGSLRVEKSSLTALARQELDLARNASSGRSSHTVYGGHEHVLRQTVIALVAGQALSEHANPGEATVHVLHGRVRLSAGDTSWDGLPGDLLIVPQAAHTLEALEASAVLLTVAKHL
jgi:quercetin dioxygenase-like cupin family protein